MLNFVKYSTNPVIRVEWDKKFKFKLVVKKKNQNVLPFELYQYFQKSFILIYKSDKKLLTMTTIRRDAKYRNIAVRESKLRQLVSNCSKIIPRAPTNLEYRFCLKQIEMIVVLNLSRSSCVSTKFCYTIISHEPLPPIAVYQKRRSFYCSSCFFLRDLSGTSIQNLPTAGLEELDILKIENTHSLTVFPSIYNFKVNQ